MGTSTKLLSECKILSPRNSSVFGLCAPASVDPFPYGWFIKVWEKLFWKKMKMEKRAFMYAKCITFHENVAMHTITIAFMPVNAWPLSAVVDIFTYVWKILFCTTNRIDRIKTIISHISRKNVILLTLGKSAASLVLLTLPRPHACVVTLYRYNWFSRLGLKGNERI